jgi:hypothetical protein
MMHEIVDDEAQDGMSLIDGDSIMLELFKLHRGSWELCKYRGEGKVLMYMVSS